MRLRQRLRLGLRIVGTLLIHLFDSVLLRLPTRAERGAAGPVLLVVRLDRIGDVVLWLPSAQRLIEAWRRRGFRVIVIVRTECAALVQGLSGVDQVLMMDCRRVRLDPVYRARLLLEVRRCGAEVAIEPTVSRVPALGDAVVRFSGAARRVGWKGDRNRATRLEKHFGDRAYTELVPNPLDEASELRRNEAFLDRIDVPAERFERVPLPRRALEGRGLPARRYVLVPGAGDPRLAGLIHRKTGWVGVICGSGGDRPAARCIMAETDAPLIDLTGETALAQLVDVIAGSALVVSNETGAIHIAAALRVPGVCVTGGGHYGRFVPYPASRLFDHVAPRVVHHPMPCFGCNWECPRRPAPGGCAPCVDGVTVEDAAVAVMAVLEAEVSALAPA